MVLLRSFGPVIWLPRSLSRFFPAVLHWRRDFPPIGQWKFREKPHVTVLVAHGLPGVDRRGQRALAGSVVGVSHCGVANGVCCFNWCLQVRPTFCFLLDVAMTILSFLSPSRCFVAYMKKIII